MTLNNTKQGHQLCRLTPKEELWKKKKKSHFSRDQIHSSFSWQGFLEINQHCETRQQSQVQLKMNARAQWHRGIDLVSGQDALALCCPSRCPLSHWQDTWKRLHPCFSAAASSLLHRCRSLPWLREPRSRESKSRCLNIQWKDKGQSHNFCLSDLALFYTMSTGVSKRKEGWEKSKYYYIPVLALNLKSSDSQQEWKVVILLTAVLNTHAGALNKLISFVSSSMMEKLKRKEILAKTYLNLVICCS